MIRSFRSIQKVQIENQYFTLCRPIRCSTFATRSDTSTEDEQNEARQWLATFTPDTIPRRLGEISFSRSSGPGGQNVNKTNSKATLRVQMRDIQPPVIPRLIYEQLQFSTQFAARSDSLVVQADSSRKQAANVENCFEKLHGIVCTAAKAVVRGETSVGQKKKVQQLRDIDNEKRLTSKKTQSAKKGARRGKGPYDY